MEEDQERKKCEQKLLEIFLLKWAEKQQPISTQDLAKFYREKTGVSFVPYDKLLGLRAYLRTKPELYTQCTCEGWIPSLRNYNEVNNFSVLQFPVGQWEPVGHKETPENFSKPEELLSPTSSRNQNLNLQLVIEDISSRTTKKKKRNNIAPGSSRFKLCGLECRNYSGPMSKSAAKSTPNSYANSLSLSTWSGWEDVSDQKNLNSTQQENEDSSNNQSETISQEEIEKENGLSDYKFSEIVVQFSVQVQRSSEQLNETSENHLQTKNKLDECPLSTSSSQSSSDKDNSKQKNDDKPNLLKEILEPVWGRMLTGEEMKIFDKVRQNKEEEEKHFRSLLENVKLSLAKSSKENENKPNESDKCNGLCPCCCKKVNTR